ncbi:uncharacterized protein LOC132718024 isoform X2 [Ruditapes philippinarum]|uniref:uncharacterized protein LOC132718024 isoform X2 n=1 Tax=Ruditapes philippinarum TaxID=129788 RepID=UPI00295C1F71|nr:uncharacterized protein LOC132718024 isoform X2 [Ruditapes philippinarum]
MDYQSVSRHCCHAETSNKESVIFCEPKTTRPCSCAECSTHVKESDHSTFRNGQTCKQGGDAAAAQGCTNCLEEKPGHHSSSDATPTVIGKCATAASNSGLKCSTCRSCSKCNSTDQIVQKTPHNQSHQLHYQRTCDLHLQQNGRIGDGRQHENSYTLNINHDKNETVEVVEPPRAKRDANMEYSKEDLSDDTSDFKERDENIRDYQLQQMINERKIIKRVQNDNAEFEKLRRNYNSLKKLFVALATLNIILIVFVVSIMPFILVTFKMYGGGEVPSGETIENIAEKQLSSNKAKDIIKEHILCVDCKRVTYELSNIFIKTDGKGCCLNDVVSLVENVLDRQEKNLNTRWNAITRNYMIGSGNRQTQSNESTVSNEENTKVSRLINTLLTRKRSAIHLSGTLRHHTMTWTHSFPEKMAGKLNHHNNAIRVESGGVYFLYSCVRFKAEKCDRTYSVGYKVMTKQGNTNVPVASVQHQCRNGVNSETDLIIQKVIEVEVATTLHVQIDYSPGLVSKDHQHYFGLFEI